MLVVKLNKTQFEYDIHSIVKAFYPEKDVKVLTPDSVVKDKEWFKKEPDMYMNFSDSKIEILMQKLYCKELDITLEKYKDEFKKFLYRCLCEETGKELPWGNLTGIRPTKIAMGMLEDGQNDRDIVAFMKEEHYVSEEKANLSLDIAKREKRLLDCLHYENGYSLYLGIPFCPTTCLYCSFTSYPICSWKNRMDEYLEAVFKEIDYVAEAYDDKILDTVYIGGGTPTTLGAEELDRLITKVKTKFNFENVKEFTVEAGRADSITKEKLEVLKKHNVTRISINPQTMKDDYRKTSHGR